MSECKHEQVSEREGETWHETISKRPHTVIHITCLYCGQKRVKQTGSDLPTTYMPIFHLPGKVWP